MINRKIFLSVDFDYFCREEPEWDWGHTEHMGNLFQELAWPLRLPWYEETLFEKHANPHPDKFWNVLTEVGFNFDECESLTVADSHLWAAPDFLNLRKSCLSREAIDIVNIDAHHDMGYASWAELKKNYLTPKKVECSNWLLVLMHQLKALRAVWICPEWKGLRDIPKNIKPSWKNLKSLDKRFQHGVYNENYLRSLGGYDVVGIFIAKSSVWTPPWHDEAFSNFVYEAAALTDLEACANYEEQEGLNPLIPRPCNPTK